jgi:hypothetical protein
MAQHDVWLAVGDPDQNPALCLIFRHRLTPSGSRPDTIAVGIPTTRQQRDLEAESRADSHLDQQRRHSASYSTKRLTTVPTFHKLLFNQPVE